MDEARRDFGKRIENKTPLGDGRMGNCQIMLMYNEMMIEKDVKVDGSWTPANRSDPPQRILDGQQGFQQINGGKNRFQLAGAVEKIPLINITYRGGFIKRRDPGNTCFRESVNQCQGLFNLSITITEIATETKEHCQ